MTASPSGWQGRAPQNQRVQTVLSVMIREENQEKRDDPEHKPVSRAQSFRLQSVFAQLALLLAQCSLSKCWVPYSTHTSTSSALHPTPPLSGCTTAAITSTSIADKTVLLVVTVNESVPFEINGNKCASTHTYTRQSVSSDETHHWQR